MMRSLYSAISGLGVNQQAMDVLGNNISNVNTIGYKAGRTIFQDMLSQTISGGTAATSSVGSTNPSQIGLGSVLATVSNIFTDGTNKTTDVDTDLAIQGDGFFILEGKSNNEFLYTRAGDFNFDSLGNLVSASGYSVQGWMADPETGEIVTDTNTEDIVVGTEYQAVEAKATTATTVAGILSTDADPNVLEFPTLLHSAEAGNSIFAVYSANGVKMDVADEEPIKIKAHATDITDMSNVFNDTDVSLGITSSANNSLLVYINNTAETFTYGTDFTTMGDLANALETRLNTIAGAADFTVSVANGKLSVAKTAAGGANVTINSFSGSARLAVALSNLAGTYDDTSDVRTSDQLYFENTVYAGRDFTTLSELAAEIEASIDGNVLNGADFSVTYDNTTGQFVYSNTGTGTAPDLTGFSFDKAYSGTDFELNMVASDPLTVAKGATGRSMTFLREAKDSDALLNLYTSNGSSLGLTNDAVMQFTSGIGGENLTGTGSQAVYSVGTDGLAGTTDDVYYTLQDLRVALADYLGYNSSSESELAQHIGSFDENAGKLVLTSNSGIPNEIDFLKFEILGSGNYSNFYDYYDYSTTQNATGGVVTTSQTIYDAQGNEHTLQYNFEMVDAIDNLWKLTVTTPETNSTVEFNESNGGSVYLHFNNNGSFNYMATEAGTRIASLTANFDPNNGAGVISDISIDLGTPSMFDGVYLSSGDGGIEKTTQDGYSTGSLEDVLFNTAGEIIGYYSNSQVVKLGQIALATFTNPNGLLKVGDTTFKSTTSSGDASVGTPGTGSRGDIASGALENSNVDLSSEFVNMITTQRGFQANSRVITTSDEMLQELLSLKR
ncbi:flagellar hook-basal body complex protein [Seleniivibrio sp.]|uniref:flagellar hook-basal body complex protein n=1 Tax=Seleniivibrio sp. TaxID=2898801 RepID=UPI0025DB39EB|nr:flagellar hook-basal body complex protein [Seleniivibrio sp.]MCD8553682.1 flagellar hook-basal body complex protein [Seleniivibrio sp.]